MKALRTYQNRVIHPLNTNLWANRVVFTSNYQWSKKNRVTRMLKEFKNLKDPKALEKVKKIDGLPDSKTYNKDQDILT